MQNNTQDIREILDLPMSIYLQKGTDYSGSGILGSQHWVCLILAVLDCSFLSGLLLYLFSCLNLFHVSMIVDTKKKVGEGLTVMESRNHVHLMLVLGFSVRVSPRRTDRG